DVALPGEGPRFPMYFVNYNEVSEFCRKLTERERQEGRLPSEWEYRLPSEAQWEYACRAGTTTRFAFGDDEAELEKYGWYEKNSNGMSHEVGQKPANAWGFHDMHGNVQEWCRDWFGDKLPGGPNPGVLKQSGARVKHGGNWSDSAPRCASAY